MVQNETPKKVQLPLSREEAIVLFEFLSRYSDENALTIVDQAEQRVLWDLCCALESELYEPISESYGEILAQARAVVRDKVE